MDDDLALFANACAFGTHPSHVLQRQMHDAAFARRHGIQPERLARRLHAFRGHARRHLQFFKAQRAITAAINMNLFVVRRLQAQRLERQVFERL
jgi:UDP-N-acetylmuramoylalanine-D-glutamate ligase